jgi:hypothetical protein
VLPGGVQYQRTKTTCCCRLSSTNCKTCHRLISHHIVLPSQFPFADKPVVAGCLPQIARHVIDSFLNTSYFQANSPLLVVFHKLQDMSSTHFSTHRTSKPIPLCWLSSTNCKTCHRLISQHIVLPSQFPFACCLPQIAIHVIDSFLHITSHRTSKPIILCRHTCLLPVFFHKFQYM